MSEQRITYCNRDCPDTCRIVATVDEGKVIRLGGDPNHPITRGALCHRTNQYLRRQYDPERVTSPRLRKDGRLGEVGWEEALDFVASTLLRIRRESGPEAIFHYRSGGTLGMVTAEVSDLFFERFGPVTIKRGDICSGAGEAAQMLDFGVSDSGSPFQLERARHVFIWGKNVYTSSPHTIGILKRAKRAGASMVLIDPVHHQTAQLCRDGGDRVVQLRPGGDFALAMAVARVLFDEGGIDPEAATYCRGLDDFCALSRRYGVAQWCEHADVDPALARDLAKRLAEGPTTILIGWGMARRRFGGLTVRALDALAAISGNIGRPGTGASFYHRRRRAFASLAEGQAARTISEPLFGQRVLAADPPVRAIWVTAGNPVAMLPDSEAVAEAFRRTELTVVVDCWMSDTAALADVVLPTATLLEADDLLGAYGHHYLGASTPAVQAPAGVKTDHEIFSALAPRMGVAHDVFSMSAREVKERLLAPVDVGLAELEGDTEAVLNPLAEEVLFADRMFPTDDGRVHLVGEHAAEAIRPWTPTDRFPLQLMALSHPKSQASQWAKEAPPRLVVRVHPDAAAGIESGARGRLISALGEVEVEVVHDAAQRSDVALVPKGGHFAARTCANAITAAALTDVGEGAAYYDQPVRLEPVPRSAETPSRGGDEVATPPTTRRTEKLSDARGANWAKVVDGSNRASHALAPERRRRPPRALDRGSDESGSRLR